MCFVHVAYKMIEILYGKCCVYRVNSIRQQFIIRKRGFSEVVIGQDDVMFGLSYCEGLI